MAMSHLMPMITLALSALPGQKVELATSLGHWEAWPMSEDRPGHYVYAFEEPWLPSVSYKFIVNGVWQPDPLNPLTEPDGNGGYNSVLQDSDFHEDPLLELQPGVAPLAESRLRLVDLEGDPREITVLRPRARRTARDSVTVYFQDGGDYLERTGVAALLANLARQRGMPAMTGVFIPPKDRMREYELLPAYSDFVTDVVVPAVESRWPGTGGSRERRLLVGPSLGGLITLYTALRRPDVFGMAASQSGSLWLGDGVLLKQLGQPVTQASQRLKLFMDCGTYEEADMLTYNRQGEELARRAGHEVLYREYPSIHDWIGWRNRLQEIFRYFFEKNRSFMN